MYKKRIKKPNTKIIFKNVFYVLSIYAMHPLKTPDYQSNLKGKKIFQ